MSETLSNESQSSMLDEKNMNSFLQTEKVLANSIMASLANAKQMLVETTSWQQTTAAEFDATESDNPIVADIADFLANLLNQLAEETKNLSDQYHQAITASLECITQLEQLQRPDSNWIPHFVRITKVGPAHDKDKNWIGFEIKLDYKPYETHILFKPNQNQDYNRENQWVSSDLTELLDDETIKRINSACRTARNCDDMSPMSSLIDVELHTRNPTAPSFDSIDA